MGTSVDQSFIKDYQSDVHVAYQQMGSRLRNTVRTKSGITGATTTFQKIGKGTASTKARHGNVPIMNIDHKPVECKLYDYYAADYIDKLDELKTNIPELKIVTDAGAYALGRKTDELIITELDKSTNFAGDDTDGLTKEKALEAFEMMGEADVPDDGERYAFVGWKQWTDLLKIDEFTKADYVGGDALPWKSGTGKKWLGTIWMPHSGLSKTGNVRNCYWYHKTAIGHAIGKDVTAEINYVGEKAAHLANNMMSQGSVLIDPSGVVSMRCLEV